jgi:60 kDa SS-A/Ro ribonucleoprotein
MSSYETSTLTYKSYSDAVKNTKVTDQSETRSPEAQPSVPVTNFMNGVSFKLSPLRSLQIVMSSMICGESQYYRSSRDAKKNVEHHAIFESLYDDAEKAEDYLAKIIAESLAYDYEGTLNFISELRNRYLMRLNPQVILACALVNSKRAEYSAENPGKIRSIIRESAPIPTDWCRQFELLTNLDKPIPSVWKREIAKMLEGMSSYHALKYLNGSKSGNGEKSKAHSSLVDLIRLTHPRSSKNPILKEIVQTGKVIVADKSVNTWERLRSEKKSWSEILNTIRMPHMALLRNLRNILEEMTEQIESTHEGKVPANFVEDLDQLCSQLEGGVLKGKQFPFRYFTAYKTLKGENPISYSRKPITSGKIINPTLLKKALSSLEACLKVSLSTIPELKGRVDCLSDNSGSAHGTFTSSYGSVKVSEIANLSALLTAMRAKKGGSVWVFGDKLKEYKVDPNGDILTQLDEINQIGNSIGQGTETGIWLFWRDAIKQEKHLDNVFIYSDMQAGYSRLYATIDHRDEMQKFNALASQSYGAYVDVLTLVKNYRENIHNRVNLFSVQVAGYDNSILPDILYRGAVLSGWTGKEALLAYEMSRVWDLIEED